LKRWKKVDARKEMRKSDYWFFILFNPFFVEFCEIFSWGVDVFPGPLTL
jgi:hypothetical protein